MLRKIARKVRHNVGTVATVATGLIVTAMSASAEVTGVAPTGMVTGFEQIKADSLAGIQAVSGYAISIVAVFLVWKYGMAFFKKIAK